MPGQDNGFVILSIFIQGRKEGAIWLIYSHSVYTITILLHMRQRVQHLLILIRKANCAIFTIQLSNSIKSLPCIFLTTAMNQRFLPLI